MKNGTKKKTKSGIEFEQKVDTSIHSCMARVTPLACRTFG